MNLLQMSWVITYTANDYMQVTGMATGENFAFFIYRHFVEILQASAVGFDGNTYI